MCSEGGLLQGRPIQNTVQILLQRKAFPALPEIFWHLVGERGCNPMGVHVMMRESCSSSGELLDDPRSGIALAPCDPSPERDEFWDAFLQMN